MDQQNRRDHAGQSSRHLRNADTQYHSPKPRSRGHYLHDIQKGKRRETAGDYTACAAHDQLGSVAMHEQLRDGQRPETDQADARKTLDSELSPELDGSAEEGRGRKEERRQEKCRWKYK